MDSVLAVDLDKTGCRAARSDGSSAGLATRGGLEAAQTLTATTAVGLRPTAELQVVRVEGGFR